MTFSLFHRTAHKTAFAIFFTVILLSTFMPRYAHSSSQPTLDEMIGQMLMIGFPGFSVDERHPVVQAIQQHNLGGVILFDFDIFTGTPGRNIQSPEQLRRLTASLQSASPVPLLIAVDQEGGRVARLKERCGFPATLSARQLGESNSPPLTHKQAKRTAETLHRAGINLNLAPVVDLNRNPQNPVIAKFDRSFSPKADCVTQHAGIFIEEHRKQHVLCSLKHFPGHGSSSADSHMGVVDVSRSWDPKELEPYRELLEKGLVDTIMTAHVFNKQIDPTFPATLSHRTITGLLREEVGFEGVVISDDMQMRAISREYGLESAVALAINAGVDILIFANNNSDQVIDTPTLIALIRKLVSNGEVSRERIEASYQRVITLKNKLGNGG